MCLKFLFSTIRLREERLSLFTVWESNWGRSGRVVSEPHQDFLRNFTEGLEKARDGSKLPEKPPDNNLSTAAKGKKEAAKGVVWKGLGSFLLVLTSWGFQTNAPLNSLSSKHRSFYVNDETPHFLSSFQSKIIAVFQFVPYRKTTIRELLHFWWNKSSRSIG